MKVTIDARDREAWEELVESGATALHRADANTVTWERAKEGTKARYRFMMNEVMRAWTGTDGVENDPYHLVERPDGTQPTPQMQFQLHLALDGADEEDAQLAAEADRMEEARYGKG